MLPKYDGDTLLDCMNLEALLHKEVLAEWKTNVNGKNNRFAKWRPNCTYVKKYVRGKIRTNYDLHYVNPVLSSGGTADVCFYVLKYMMKPSNRAIRLQQALHLNLSDDEYMDIWSIVRPRHFESEGLGYGQCVYDKELAAKYHRRFYQIAKPIHEHLLKGIELSKKLDEPIPSYFSPEDGKPYPLAKYYKDNGSIFTMDDYLDFFYASKKMNPDNVVIKERDHYSQECKRIDDFEKKVNDVSFNQTAYELDDVFDDFDSDFVSVPDISLSERETDLRFLEQQFINQNL